MAIAEHAEDNKKTLYRAATNLSSATRLLNYLVKLSCDLSDTDYDVLQSVLTPHIIDNGEQVRAGALNAENDHLKGKSHLKYVLQVQCDYVSSFGRCR